MVGTVVAPHSWNKSHSSIFSIRGCFQRAEVLRLKQEELLERRGEVEETAPCTSKDVCRGEKEGGVVDEDGSSDKDDELEMDWRAKHS